MSDAAAFFAKKKKKKKTFKFNANTIDASQVTTTVHVDAPALSTDDVVPTTGALPSPIDTANDDSQWDDEALAANTRKGTAVVVTSGATTKDLLVETKALSLQTHTGSEQEEIAAKMRIEETKAQLAAAKEGMAREAQRIKEEKEKKEEQVASSRFAAAAGSGGKWVPSRMRGAGATGGGWGSARTTAAQKVNTEDENLFPDLAAADAILEKQKAEQPAYKAPTKTPVGGGATWGAASAAPKTRPKLNLKKKTEPAKAEEAPPAPEPKAAEEAPPAAAPAPAPEPAPEPAPAATPAAAPAPLKPKKKKKKKDLSTFGKK